MRIFDITLNGTFLKTQLRNISYIFQMLIPNVKSNLKKQVASLRIMYTVIVFVCDSRIPHYECRIHSY